MAELSVVHRTLELFGQNKKKTGVLGCCRKFRDLAYILGL